MNEQQALMIIQQQQRINLEQQQLISMMMGTGLSTDIAGFSADIPESLANGDSGLRLADNRVITADDFIVKDFRDWLYGEGATENTVDSYTFTARQFFEKYGELNKANLNKYREYLESNFKVKTVNLRYTAMEKLFKYLNYNGYKFKRLKSQNRTFCDNAINEEQYERLIRYAEANRPRAALLIKVLANTGVRVSELIELRTANLDIGYQDIVSKAHKQRRIYFPKSLVSDIRNRCGKVYICESRYGGQYTTRGVSAVLQDCAKGSGVPKEVLHPHSFRHFFAKMFLKSNNDITLLGDLLGHSNISTTAIYTRKSSAEQAQELDRIIKW